MAITKEQKQGQVQELAELFGQSQLTVLVDYRGLEVEAMQELRRQLKAQGGNLKVAKKTLMQRALAKNQPLRGIDIDAVEGAIALAFGFDDEVTPAQIVENFAKANPALEIKGGITADGRLMSIEKVKYLASLPSKPQLLGQLVATMAAPVRGLVSVLGGNLRGLVQVLNGYSQKQG
ncbi:50S ribosomal protein L10 [Candidatus Microgenomates bacterium]|nr:50S ribosomal protein L10 [Candidatus Microgenomates bacterium]